MERPDDDGVAELTCSYCNSSTCPAALNVNAACPEEEADELAQREEDEAEDEETDDFLDDDEEDESLIQ